MTHLEMGLLLAFTVIAPGVLGIVIAAGYDREFRRKYPDLWEMQRRRRMRGEG